MFAASIALIVLATIGFLAATNGWIEFPETPIDPAAEEYLGS